MECLWKGRGRFYFSSINSSILAWNFKSTRWFEVKKWKVLDIADVSSFLPFANNTSSVIIYITPAEVVLKLFSFLQVILKINISANYFWFQKDVW